MSAAISAAAITPLLFFKRDATAGRGRRNCVDMPLPPSIAGPRSAGPDPISNRTYPFLVAGNGVTSHIPGEFRTQQGGYLRAGGLRRAADPWRRPAARLHLGLLHLEGEPSGRAATGDAHPDRARPADLVLGRLSPGTRKGAGRKHGSSVARKECYVIRSATRDRHPESELPLKERCDLR